MSGLTDVQLETFAQALALGTPARRAAEEAGYDDPPGQPYARALEPDVAARVTEIRLEREGGAHCELKPLIDELLGIAWACRREATVAAYGAAIRALAEAAKLKRLLPPPPMPRRPHERELTREEWRAKYAPNSVPVFIGAEQR